MVIGRFVFAFLIAVLCLSDTRAARQPTPVGAWKTVDADSGADRALVRVSEKNGLLFATIEKLLDPQLKPDAVCGSCRDWRKDKPLVGLQLIAGAKLSQHDSSVWDGGEILDPSNGKTYHVRMALENNGKSLSVRGFVGSPSLGRTQIWTRVE
jgi:uncharacterized protein (DUF2147 family)